MHDDLLADLPNMFMQVGSPPTTMYRFSVTGLLGVAFEEVHVELDGVPVQPLGLVAASSKDISTEAEQTILFSTPQAGAPSTVFARVRGSAAGTSLNALPFEYEDPLAMLSLSPSSGPMGGKTLINVQGRGFKTGSFKPMCQFDAGGASKEVPAVVHSETLMSCTSPPIPRKRTVYKFSIHLNSSLVLQHEVRAPTGTWMPVSEEAGQHNLSFHVYPGCPAEKALGPVSRRSRLPQRVPCPLPVQIEGVPVLLPPQLLQERLNAAAGLDTEFESFAVSRAMSCNAPEGQEANCTLSWEITFPLSFEVPSKPSLFAFGQRSVSELKATWMPPSTQSQHAQVRVSMNGQNFSPQWLSFEYSHPVWVKRLSPHHGSLRGGTPVLVTGSGFECGRPCFCSFLKDGGLLGVVEASEVYNSTHLLCLTPASSTPGEAAVTVSLRDPGVGGGMLDTGVSSRDILFTYYPELEISELTPPQSWSTGGHTVVVKGANFPPTDELACRFGNKSVPARWIDDSLLSCETPPHQPGFWILEVSGNGKDFTRHSKPFLFYPPEQLSHLDPVFGPAVTAGSAVSIFGQGFVNTSLLSCRFDSAISPATFMSPEEVVCHAPSIEKSTMLWQSLQWHQTALPDPRHGSLRLFPGAHHYPWYLSKLSSVEVTNNLQEWTASGLKFLHAADAEVHTVAPRSTRESVSVPVFIKGRNFLNTTSLSCRIGDHSSSAVFVSSSLILCFSARRAFHKPEEGTLRHGQFKEPGWDWGHAARITTDQPHHALVEISNNGLDFTFSRGVFEVREPCPSGHFCPTAYADDTFQCPRGTYCAGTGNSNFTLCPKGTYQAEIAASECYRCPIGYFCPERGMVVPRICPAGFVCEVTGLERAEQPCPQGHFCPEGTATSATTCGDVGALSSRLVPAMAHAEMASTLRLGRPASAQALGLGARHSACFDNSTSDFGLQSSKFPARFWSEAHRLPLAPDAAMTPLRGQFCLDDTCMRIGDEESMSVSDAFFDYTSTEFSLRRPIPCPSGTYCHVGTASPAVQPDNFTSAQTCFRGSYCPEGSASPQGFGKVAPGFFSRSGVRVHCPVGTFCPAPGMTDPRPCQPGEFNGQLAQTRCNPCPEGYICPGFGRSRPAICPVGYVCSKPGLASPNILCPAGYYCNNGTRTSDPFRNDTTLRPYPCKPGTYCIAGTGYDTVVPGSPLHAQNCTAGFFCEAASPTPLGSGLCPKGFYCPVGTAVPIPTPKGAFAELEGVQAPARCPQGFYSPTIESETCVPCPPGTNCENDGTEDAVLCPPGSFRSLDDQDGIVCKGCPQGTWSKQWELRMERQCTTCPPGVVCPRDGTTHPCGVSDLPLPYVPLAEEEQLNRYDCEALGDGYFFGVLEEPIDSRGQGGVLNGSESAKADPQAKCYTNESPLGSVLFQRYQDFHGPLFEITRGEKHQGYSSGQYGGYFNFGSLHVDLPFANRFEPGNNCTVGFWLYDDDTQREVYYSGNCEAEQICNYYTRPQAEPCEEGFVCDSGTTALTALDVPCSGGYVCNFGTTPDFDLQSPAGQFNALCPAGYYCLQGTGQSRQFNNRCPAGFFCPTGTHDPTLGLIAGDGFARKVPREALDPFASIVEVKTLPGELSARPISLHDERCFKGIDPSLAGKKRQMLDDQGRPYDLYVTVENNLLCGRDHKWRSNVEAVSRQECDCSRQVKLLHEVFRMWSCTEDNEFGSCGFDVVSSGPATGVTATLEFRNAHPGETRPWRNERRPPPAYPPEYAGEPHGRLRYTVPLPPPTLAPAYFRECEDVSRDCIARGDVLDITEPCIHFCSWAEAKEYVEEQWLEEVEQTALQKLRGNQHAKVDPLIYDLKYAMDLLDETRVLARPDLGDDDRLFLGNKTLSFINLDAEDGTILRADMCACESALRCPNGTSSSIGASSISDCVREGDESLRRLTPVPNDEEVLVNSTELMQLTELFNPVVGLGKVQLKALQVATLSLNLTGLSTNFTFNDHYRLSTYVDCEPCPPRYKCSLVDNPPTCSYPDLQQQASHGALCEECCLCQPHANTYWLDTNVAQPPFFDNKHTIVQVQITALQDVNLLVTLELMHGLYYQDYDEGFLGIGALKVHTPGRASYTKGESGNRKAFMALLVKADFDKRAMPMNLPSTRQRVIGTTSGEEEVLEDAILIDRPADPSISDSRYLARLFERSQQEWLYGSTLKPDSGQRRLVHHEVPENLAADKKPANLRYRRRMQAAQSSAAFGPYTPIPLRPIPNVDLLRDPPSLAEADSTWWTTVADDDISFLGLPYLPFFSNCHGYDSHVILSKLLEDHPACTIVPYEETKFVAEWPWQLQLSATADSCIETNFRPVEVDGVMYDNDGKGSPGVPLYCAFEEEVFSPTTATRWFELEEGDTLFYLTKEPISAGDFVADTDQGTGWGRSQVLEAVLDSALQIPVTVLTPFEETLVPRRVDLTIEFFQFSQGGKRIVRSSIDFADRCTTSRVPKDIEYFASRGYPPCQAGDYNYTLVVKYDPLDWLSLLNLFEFQFGVYFVLFVMVGGFINIIGLAVFAAHRLATTVRYPPPFRYKGIMRMSAPAPVAGVIIATTPVVFAIGLTMAWFLFTGSSDPENFPATHNFEGVSGDWLDTAGLTLDRIDKYAMGRIGSAFILLGLFMVTVGTHAYVPHENAKLYEKDNAMNSDSNQPMTVQEDMPDDEADEQRAKERQSEAKEDEGPVFYRPLEWKRASFFLASLLEQVVLLLLLEFAYSDIFAENQYIIILIYKFMQVFVELSLLTIVQDSLLASPLIVELQVVEILVTMGADTFTGFVSAFLVEVLSMMVERIYFDPGVKRLVTFLPLYWHQCKARCRTNRKLTKDQRDAEEAEARNIEAAVLMETEGLEPMIDALLVHSNETIALMMTPFVQLFLLASDATPLHRFRVTQIPRNFSIRPMDLVFYTMFALIIIPFQLSLDVILLNVQELAHGWKLFEYMSYHNWRFATRDRRWIMNSRRLDASISPKLQLADKLCFSSQFYFMAAGYAWGLLLLLLGATIHLRQSYNMFSDVLFGVILLFTWGLGYIAMRVSARVGNFLGLWRRTRFEVDTDDDEALRLALGGGESKGAEADRQEMMAMNSERFRQKFLDRNRPWIVAHLAELLTPRVLDSVDKDGKQYSTTVRELYGKLEEMGADSDLERARAAAAGAEGADAGDAADLNPDWIAALKENPLPEAGVSLARWWLQQARRRLVYSKAITDIMEASKRSVCDSCGRVQSEQVQLKVKLGVAGVVDSMAIDKLIAAFEAAQQMDEDALEVDAWKAFVRSHAEFVMQCNLCEKEAVKEKEKRRRQNLYGAIAQERVAAQQAANDSEDEVADVAFEPVSVNRQGVVGSIMSKWLAAARKKLGGTFPRPEAEHEMAVYAARMAELRRKRTEAAVKRRKAELHGAPEGSSTPAEARPDKAKGTEELPPVTLSPASAAIAQKWLFAMKHTIMKRRQEAIQATVAEVQKMAAKFRPEDDWYFSASHRQKGEELAAAVADVWAARNAASAGLEEELKKQDEAHRRKLLTKKKTLASAGDQAQREVAAWVATQEALALDASADARQRRQALEEDMKAALTGVESSHERQSIQERFAPQLSAVREDIRRLEQPVREVIAARTSATGMAAFTESVRQRLSGEVVEATVRHQRLQAESHAQFADKADLASASWVRDAEEWLSRSKALLEQKKAQDAVEASKVVHVGGGAAAS